MSDYAPSAERPPSYHRRRYTRALERRCDHVAERLDEWDGPTTSAVHYIRAELAALCYALHIIEAASARGVVHELEEGWSWPRGTVTWPRGTVR
jgi:hypothetical protein